MLPERHLLEPLALVQIQLLPTLPSGLLLFETGYGGVNEDLVDQTSALFGVCDKILKRI